MEKHNTSILLVDDDIEDLSLLSEVMREIDTAYNIFDCH